MAYGLVFMFELCVSAQKASSSPTTRGANGPTGPTATMSGEYDEPPEAWRARVREEIRKSREEAEDTQATLRRNTKQQGLASIMPELGFLPPRLEPLPPSQQPKNAQERAEAGRQFVTQQRWSETSAVTAPPMPVWMAKVLQGVGSQAQCQLGTPRNSALRRKWRSPALKLTCANVSSNRAGTRSE